MADELKLRQDAVMGQRAKEILESELVQEAFRSIEAGIMESWKNSGGNDVDVRERSYNLYSAFLLFKVYFQRAIASGDKAARDLKRAEAHAIR